MTTFLGMTEINVDDFQYFNEMQNVYGQEYVNSAVTEYVTTATEIANTAVNIFVEDRTSQYKRRYGLPMTGEMIQNRPDGAIPVSDYDGKWDTAFPIFTFTDGQSMSWEQAAYMSLMDMNNHIDGVIGRYYTTLRKQILTALFNNTDYTFKDDNAGNITVVGLANGDSTLYPPALGNTSPRTLDAYNVTGYTAANISDTNNPFSTAQTYFTNSYGRVTGTRRIRSFINQAQRAKVEALTAFYPVTPNDVQLGDNTSVATSFENDTPLVGEFIGIVNGCEVYVWDFIPENYILHVDPSQPAPVRIRVDPAATGLGSGELIMLPEPQNPVRTYTYWKTRMGTGVGNRLNGYIQQLKASGVYDIPTGYER